MIFYYPSFEARFCVQLSSLGGDDGRSEALAAFDLEAHKALQAAYGEGFKEPLAAPEGGPAGLLAALVKSLREVAAAIGQLADVESRTLLTLVLTQVCSHLSLRDPTLDMASLSEPVTTVMEGTAAEALGAKVTKLVEAFL